ncbi:MBL fold metallo-hydrolase [Azoarcus indigens]|uniref:Glyoxylase-like metal-dependent hydrolase (Beta-lactamase superfamily II) n=1 Tax=Azoarcus indigens TaxID=29545 RepID=A0A4R6ECP8_9RHOO|nr:MBL fold metallo-hydrolase [Azoarcus indigens]NMG65910.1 MBL fold metallo-hydrolase [Azoarcus indigens]TDN55940.1 glyoxylase-like metal-dependent hydrolase (beta-lactamase superfamily II) [Azoarcus indigens]
MKVLHTLFAAGLALAATAAAAGEALSLKVYNADAQSFNVNSVLISGPTEAVVVDAGFTRADAYRIAANVLDSGKKLTTVLVSNADPDYYFGAEVLKQLFPDARVVTTPAVRSRIQTKMQAKLGFWGPKMGANAPQSPVLPDLLQGNTVTVDGEALEVRGTTGLLAHRPYVWVPALRAVVGNVAVFGNMHVWTADTKTVEERAAWIAQLDEMAALMPAVVVPGHMKAGTPIDAANLSFTRDYLKRFDAAVQESAGSAQLMQAMQAAYPQLGTSLSLEIGAKVVKGEMPW